MLGWRRFSSLVLSCLACLPCLACSARDDDGGAPAGNGATDAGGRPPATARWQLFDDLVADRDRVRNPADGGGRAWLAAGDEGQAGQPGSWTIVYEAGPLGVAEGGTVYLQVSPFWGWSQPWADPLGEAPPGSSDRFPGFTTVTTEAAGISLEPETVDKSLLAIHVLGRALAPGEQLTIVYGAGAAGAVADRYADRRSPFWIAVDGDGDGQRELVPDPPRVDVVAGPAAQLSVLLPSGLAPGQTGRLSLAVLDGQGSAGVSWAGTVVLDAPPELGLPATVELAVEDRGVRAIEFVPTVEDWYRIVAQAGDGLMAISNPLIVQADVEPILWADLHGHSGLSDGTGTPEDYFRYARDVAALDVVALTDHDHWGFPFLDAHPELWDAIVGQVQAFHEPGRFVTLLGYEWTSWIHGHRHVLSFEAGDDLTILSSLDPRYESPRQLWDALAGRDVLTFAHHSAGDPIATNWDFVPDPVMEPVTEIMSVHGSSEAQDSPRRVRGGVPGNFVRDILDRGLRFGFVGSGDSHDGHPGMAHLAAGQGGLAALLTGDLSRVGVLAALRARRTYATSGTRIVLRSSLDGHRMGATIPERDVQGQLVLVVHGTAPLQRIDIVRSGSVVERREFEPDSAPFDHLDSWSLPGLGPGEYVYVRVIQVDGHMAWTSPFFVEDDP